MGVLEVLGHSRSVKLSQIVAHREDDTNDEQNTEESGVFCVIVNVDGVHINQHDG